MGKKSKNKNVKAQIGPNKTRARREVEKAVEEGMETWKATLKNMYSNDTAYKFKGHFYLRISEQTKLELLTQEQEELLQNGEYFRQVIRDFLINELFPIIEQLWNQGPGGAGASKYLPTWTVSTSRSSSRRTSSLDQDEDSRKQLSTSENDVSTVTHTADTMKSGFQKIIEVLKTVTSNVTSGSENTIITAGLGNRNELFGLKLSQYMPVKTKSKSDFNSLFKAVEYGTGIADNVGGENWVRYSSTMPSKDHSRSATEAGERGAWFFSAPGAEGTGMRFTGQKGAHVFYDETTRDPNPLIYQFIEDNFRNYFVKALSKKLGGIQIST
jgi:hypothetical protein